MSSGWRSDFQCGYIRWNRAINVGNDYTYGGEAPTAHITVGGDFNGDGKADIATMVDYGNCAVGLWTHLGRADGGFDAPVESWKKQPRAVRPVREIHRLRLQRRRTLRHRRRLHVRQRRRRHPVTVLANPDGTIGTPVLSWNATGVGWNRPSVQLVAGDVNGDHGTDMAMM
ncbi:hypothetical protein ACU686_09590 [Yinghuangia aomiensis]